MYQADRTEEPAGGWVWEGKSGQQLAFEAQLLPWYPGEPGNYAGNEHCAAITPHNGQATVHDGICTYPYFYVCEYGEFAGCNFPLCVL